MSADHHPDHEHGGPGYASPQVARQQPPEQFVYVAALYEGTGIDRPDFIAVADVDPGSPSYGQIVHHTEMTNVGDELHHFGWNACSSACHSQLQRDTMIVPGMRSSRLHIIDISDPRAPRIKNVIEGEEIKEKLGLSAPHTVHCMPGDIVTISMLGDADGNTPGGFAVLDAREFSIAERWEREPDGLEFTYDFWYQPRQNTLISSEWAAPNTFLDGFNPADVAAGKYGRRLHFWDLERRAKVQTIDLGEEGLIPLEIRWQHDPDSAQGFVGATLSSNIIRFHRDNSSWAAEKVIDVANEELEGWPLEGGVPGLITDLVLSLDDKDLFFSNWLHGDLRHYDVSDPTKPQLRSQVWLGGLLGRDGGHPKAAGPLNGGPQMLQNSLDGERVYVTNSLFSTWDNQFYSEIRGWLTKLDRQPDGTYALDWSLDGSIGLAFAELLAAAAYVYLLAAKVGTKRDRRRRPWPRGRRFCFLTGLAVLFVDLCSGIGTEARHADVSPHDRAHGHVGRSGATTGRRRAPRARFLHPPTRQASRASTLAARTTGVGAHRPRRLGVAVQRSARDQPPAGRFTAWRSATTTSTKPSTASAS